MVFRFFRVMFIKEKNKYHIMRKKWDKDIVKIRIDESRS